MGYPSFHMSRTGASHIRRGLPCQDASACRSEAGYAIAIVADGHGNRRHFRSDRGAAIACQVAMEAICAFLEGGSRPSEDSLTALKARICDAWLAAVAQDYRARPWEPQELEEARGLLTGPQYEALESGRDAATAYGSTLCAVFAGENFWAAIQLGDGCFVKIGRDGAYDWPMPESTVNEGSRTASLCMRQPMADFRHCWGEDDPAGLLVFTDGIEKVFPSQGSQVISLLHWIWRNQQSPGREENLARTLDMLTQRSPIGDDVSVAGIVDLEAEDTEPVPGPSQKRRELARLTAQMEEIQGTLSYNAQRLRDARRTPADIRSGAVEQLERILERKRAEAARLQEAAAQLRRELGLPEEPPAEPEPDFGDDWGVSLERDDIYNLDWDILPQPETPEQPPIEPEPQQPPVEPEPQQPPAEPEPQQPPVEPEPDFGDDWGVFLERDDIYNLDWDVFPQSEKEDKQSGGVEQ